MKRRRNPRIEEPGTIEPGPIRTCIGCRRRARPTELVRVVAREGVVALDREQRLPGRGAWLHPTAECFAAATHKRAWGRALRESGSLDLSVVLEYGATPV
jgi:predicted RNA-binding protein YlxR (DUF448 family)